MTLRSGFARGIYSSEAGIGTTSIAYAAATTDYPARQALWGLVEVGTSTFFNVFNICSSSFCNWSI